jgi:nucleotide-binding universal stress UspA family protein
MPANAVVGLKPDLDNTDLLNLTTSVIEAGAKIHLVSLVQVSKESDERERLDATRDHVEKVAERLRADGYDVETLVQISAIGLGAELASIATRLEADLLVIGLAKRSRVGKALLGSDAQSVMMHATCPVLANRIT